METQARIKALDLFAGTGWGVACQRLGIKEAGVEIMPEACATRAANGMETIYHDVWDGLELTAEEHRARYGSYQLLIASPPCQTFSLAGNGAGRAAMNEVLEAIDAHAYKSAAELRAFGEKHDPRTALVLTPLAYVWRDRPKLVAMEQVPTVLPVWEAVAEVMRALGYEVKVEILNAEQYGVPQTRRRAILVARRGGPVSLPVPTHSRYYSRTPEKLDPGVKKWVSMAEALGWGAVDQPSHTIAAGNAHGPDRWASGGASVRAALDAKIGGPAWVPKDHSAEQQNAATQYADRFQVEDVARLQTYPVGRGLTARPSPTITGGGTETGGAEPIAKYHERYTGAPDWQGSTARLDTEEAAALQTYPTMFRGGHRPNAVRRPTGHPAPTIIAGHDTENRGWVDDSARGCRPATPDEVAAFQTYEAPFVWCGTKNKKFLQIGNAVPPLLAEHVLAALVGIVPGR